MVVKNFPSLENSYDYSADSYDYNKICEAELILGVTSKKCLGNGICSLYIKGSLRTERAYCHFAEVTITKDISQQLLFAFSKKSMRKSTIKKYFNKPAFIMEEDFVLPAFVQEQLSITRPVIEKGAYLMYSFAGNYHVLFP